MASGVGEEGEGEPEVGKLGGRDDGCASDLLGPVQERCQVVDLGVERDPALSAVLAGADPAGDPFSPASTSP